MKPNFYFRLNFFILLFICLAVSTAKAQTPTFECYVTNDTLISPTVYQFDLYLLRTGTDSFEYAAGQWGIAISSAVANGGVLTPSIVPGSSALFSYQAPLLVNLPSNTYVFNIAGKSPPGAGSGSIISNISGGCLSPGTRIATFRITNSVPFSNMPMNHEFNFIAAAGRTQTKIFAYINAINTDITSSGTFYSYNTPANCIHNSGGSFTLSIFNQEIPVSCFGRSDGAISIIPYGGSPPYSFDWSTGATTQNISGLAFGSYSVTVTDANSDTATTTLTVSQPALLTAMIVSQGTIFCNRGNTTVTIGATGGTGATSGTGTFIRSAGSYTFTVTDANGCTATVGITITEPSAINISIIKTDVTACGGADGSATVSVSGAFLPVTYLWSNGAIGPSINNLAPGTYSVTVTDAGGCTATAQVTTMQPTIQDSIIATFASCGGGNGSITVYPYGAAPPYFFNWSTGATSQTVSVPVGVYSITITDVGGCNKMDSYKLITNTAPPIILSPNTSICLGASTSLSASGGVSYAWSPSTGLLSTSGPVVVANPIVTTTYTVIVTDASGCANIGTVKVTVNPLPNITVSSNPSVCSGQSTVLSASGGVSYVWSPSTGLSSTTGSVIVASPFATTTYTVTGTNPFGCISRASTTITVNPWPVVTISPSASVAICLGDSVHLSVGGGISYSWTPATGLSCTLCSNPIAFPSVTTHYTVTVISATGCTTRDTVTVNVLSTCNFNKIAGNCFIDYNQNNIKDAGEPGYYNVKIVSTGSGIFSTQPDKQGNFSNYTLDTGIVTTTIQNLPYFSATPTQHTSNFPSFHNTDNVNFALKIISNIQDLQIAILPLSQLRTGRDADYIVQYSNVGADTVNGSIFMVKDARTSFVSSSPSQISINGDSIGWAYSNLLPAETRTINVKLKVALPPTVNIGDLLSTKVVIEPVASDINPLDNRACVCEQPVVGSYDPNDKSMLGGNVFTTVQVANSEYLNYLIRFQNTGNDTAFKIVLRDTLDNKIDGSNFEMVSASHNYIVSIENNKYVKWTFENVLLPDSNIDEPGSHGYVCYRVKTKGGITAGDMIRNTAHIYFDYNAPVATNTVVTSVEFPVTTPVLQVTDNGFYLFPNPVKGNMTIGFELSKADEVTIIINNLLGETTAKKDFSSLSSGRHEILFDTQNFPEGIYFVNVVIDGNSQVKKMAKME